MHAQGLPGGWMGEAVEAVHGRFCHTVQRLNANDATFSARTAVGAPTRNLRYYLPRTPPRRISGRSLRGLPLPPPRIGSRASDPLPTQRLRPRRRLTEPSPSWASLLPYSPRTATSPSGPTEARGVRSSSIACFWLRFLLLL